MQAFRVILKFLLISAAVNAAKLPLQPTAGDVPGISIQVPSQPSTLYQAPSIGLPTQENVAAVIDKGYDVPQAAALTSTLPEDPTLGFQSAGELTDDGNNPSPSQQANAFQSQGIIVTVPEEPSLLYNLPGVTEDSSPQLLLQPSVPHSTSIVSSQNSVSQNAGQITPNNGPSDFIVPESSASYESSVEGDSDEQQPLIILVQSQTAPHHIGSTGDVIEPASSIFSSDSQVPSQGHVLSGSAALLTEPSTLYALPEENLSIPSQESSIELAPGSTHNEESFLSNPNQYADSENTATVIEVIEEQVPINQFNIPNDPLSTITIGGVEQVPSDHLSVSDDPLSLIPAGGLSLPSDPSHIEEEVFSGQFDNSNNPSSSATVIEVFVPEEPSGLYQVPDSGILNQSPIPVTSAESAESISVTSGGILPVQSASQVNSQGDSPHISEQPIPFPEQSSSINIPAPSIFSIMTDNSENTATLTEIIAEKIPVDEFDIPNDPLATITTGGVEKVPGDQLSGSGNPLSPEPADALSLPSDPSHFEEQDINSQFANSNNPSSSVTVIEVSVPEEPSGLYQVPDSGILNQFPIPVTSAESAESISATSGGILPVQSASQVNSQGNSPHISEQPIPFPEQSSSINIPAPSIFSIMTDNSENTATLTEIIAENIPVNEFNIPNDPLATITTGGVEQVPDDPLSGSGNPLSPEPTDALSLPSDPSHFEEQVINSQFANSNNPSSSITVIEVSVPEEPSGLYQVPDSGILNQSPILVTSPESTESISVNTGGTLPVQSISQVNFQGASSHTSGQPISFPEQSSSINIPAPSIPSTLYEAPQPYSGKAIYQVSSSQNIETVLQSASDKTSVATALKNAIKGMPYEFQWDVDGSESGGQAFNQRERSDGQRTSGQYRVTLPDGRIQVVNYFDDGNGFHADITYE